MKLYRVNTVNILAFLFCIVLLFSGMSSASSLISVNNTTGKVADYTSIQEAVDNAVPGDTIMIYQGIYSENVDIGKQVSIISESGNPDETVIMAANISDHVFYVNFDNVTIEGLTIEGATNCNWDDRIAGIFLESDNCTILNNKLTGNYEGIILCNSNLNVLEMNNVFNNINGNGISLDNSDQNILISNTISSNWWTGISLSSSDDNEVINNTLVSNLRGIYLYASSNNLIVRNNANSNHLYGIALATGSNNNELSLNIANFNEDSGIYLKSVNSNVLSDNVADSNYYNGILIKFSSNNELVNNSASYNMPDTTFDDNENPVCGIYLTNSEENDIVNNLIHLNKDAGICAQESGNNLISSNILVSSSTGLLLQYSSNNLVYNNYFNNPINVAYEGVIFGNTWNISLKEKTNVLGGNLTGGNFWSDPYITGHSQLCEDLDGNGICDLPYMISSKDTDYLPLYDSTCSHKGDFDCDGSVNFDDFVEFAACYNSVIGKSNYQGIFDFENDCDVDFSDFVEFAGHYQK